MRARLDELKKNNIKLQEDVAKRNNEIKQIQPRINEEQLKIEHLKKEITVDSLKAIFKFLDTKYAEGPAYIMEALVGLMRRMKRADIRSVELYTKTYEGFSIGLSKIQLEDLVFDHCDYHLQQLNEKYSSMIGTKELSIFKPYHDLLKECVTQAALGKQMAQNRIEKEKSEKAIHDSA